MTTVSREKAEKRAVEGGADCLNQGQVVTTDEQVKKKAQNNFRKRSLTNHIEHLSADSIMNVETVFLERRRKST